MCDQYRGCEQFGESSCKSSMRRTEQTAAVNVAPGTVCRPCPQRSFPAVHITHHSVQGRAENAELNEEPALNQRGDIVSPAPVGLKNQDLVDQRRPGHWNKDGQGDINLDNFRLPHPRLSSRLSLYGPDGLSSEVTSRGGAHDADTADEHDNLMPLDDHAGDPYLQSCHSISSNPPAPKLGAPPPTMAQSPSPEGQAQGSRTGTRSNQSTINGLLDAVSKSGTIQLEYSSAMLEIRVKRVWNHSESKRLKTGL
jgi:hypothetical protein